MRRVTGRYSVYTIKNQGNYTGMLIGRPITILYFLARKITAKSAEYPRVVNRLCPLRVTLWLTSRFGYSIHHVQGSPHILKSLDSCFRTGVATN